MPDLDQSIASNRGNTDEQMQSTGFSFVAPASPELGGEINVAVLANRVGQGSDIPQGVAIEAIRQSFLSNPTTDIFAAISNALKRANDSIIARRSTQPDAEITGCSTTLAVIAGDRLFVGSIGDNRVYLFREDNIETLAADQTWVQEALQAWRVKPGEIQDHSEASTPKQYLGKDNTIIPRLAPIEFLWPGDILLLCTAAVASRLRDNEIRDLVTANSPSESSRRLIQTAADRGGTGHLTGMVIQVPQPAGAYDGIPLPGRRGFSLSPVAIALVLVNLLLICLVAGVILRGSSFLSPSQGVEVAKPAFVATTPAPGLDVGPEEATPTIPSAPAAAPTLAPTRTATPAQVPTFTPQSVPANWAAPQPPPLLQPADGFVFSGPEASVILAWDPVGPMPDDVFYVVTIRKWVNGKYIGQSLNWTKANRIRLDSSFYTAFNDGARRFANASPDLAGAVNQFEWSIAIYRLTLINPDGTLQGVPLGKPTSSRHFTWGPALPTRVYGG